MSGRPAVHADRLRGDAVAGLLEDGTPIWANPTPGLRHCTEARPAGWPNTGANGADGVWWAIKPYGAMADPLP